ncbi:MAG: hypothetical protein ACKOEX_10125 [Planctomycetia bacterium]
MHGRTGFIKLLGFVLGAALSSRAYSEPFDGLVVTDGGPSQQSVLISPPVSSMASAGSLAGPNELNVPFNDGHESFANGSASCAHGCQCECRHSSDSREGWINRFLDRCGCHSWTAQVDALMLWQGNIPSRPLLRQETAPGATVLDANQAQTKMGAGPRFGLFFNLDPCHSIEGNYFWVDGFDGERTVPAGSYSTVTMPNPPVPSPVSAATLLTTAQFKSAELNWRWKNNEVLTWLMGFRWVEWNQGAGFGGQSGAGESFVVAGVTGNDLYGSQIGADLLIWDAGRRFRLNGVGKAGVFGNRAYQAAIGLNDSGVSGPVTVSGTQTSFFGEVGMYGDLAITRWLSWRTGYVLFWGTGLALPTENLSLVNFDTPTASRINITESVLVHGVTTGLEARW